MGGVTGASGNWLSQLAPDHAPTAALWWPPAPGWWVLAALLVALGVVFVVRYRRPAARLRRLALREFKALHASAANDAHLAVAAQHLLRRYAVAAYGREAVAALSGTSWLAFVVEKGGAPLAGEVGEAMLRCAYGDVVTIDRQRLLDGVRAFIEAKP
jgi:hypothetical protein